MNVNSIIDDGTAESIDTDLDLDDVAHLLRVERRRQVIRQLERIPERISVRELSERVTEARHGVDYEYYERKREYVTLYQNHLPKMDELGVLDYDDERNVIRPGPEYDVAREVLNAVEEVVR